MRLLAFLGHVSYVCPVVTAFCMLAFLVFPAAAEPASPPISGSNGLMGLWGANSSSAPRTDSSRKPIEGLKTPTGHYCSWDFNRVGSSERGRGRARVEPAKRAPRERALARFSIRFQWIDRVELR